jgi:hypothetical protein
MSVPGIGRPWRAGLDRTCARRMSRCRPGHGVIVGRGIVTALATPTGARTPCPSVVSVACMSASTCR